MPREEAFCGIGVHPPARIAGRSSISPIHPSVRPFILTVRPKHFVFSAGGRGVVSSSRVRSFVGGHHSRWGSFTTRYSLIKLTLTHCRTNPFHSALRSPLSQPSLTPVAPATSLPAAVLLAAVANSKRKARPWTTDALSLACKQRTQWRSDGRTGEGNQVCCEIEKLVEGREEGRKGVIRLEE